VWLFSARIDLTVFLGAALLSAGLALAAPALGLTGDTPLWAWLALVVFIDVAHVWATLFRVYFDGEELARRPMLYFCAPLLGYAAGVALHSVSGPLFWRVLAYVAVLHFIRQQAGWMTLYGRRAGNPPWVRHLDAAAIYAATLGPVIWWHANLPRTFWWFVENDFISGLPKWLGTAALVAHALVLLVWLASQLIDRSRFHPGKAALLFATWLVWFVGIVWARDDFSFTVSNVVLHGVPYFALLYRYAKGRSQEPGYGFAATLLKVGVPGFLSVLLVLAFAEELFWDKLVWHERPALFGSGLSLPEAALTWLVPLLALPQVTHYVLDGFVWRSRENPALTRRLGWSKT
jgi:hypothetical protein